METDYRRIAAYTGFLSAGLMVLLLVANSASIASWETRELGNLSAGEFILSALFLVVTMYIPLFSYSVFFLILREALVPPHYRLVRAIMGLTINTGLAMNMSALAVILFSLQIPGTVPDYETVWILMDGFLTAGSIMLASTLFITAFILRSGEIFPGFTVPITFICAFGELLGGITYNVSSPAIAGIGLMVTPTWMVFISSILLLLVVTQPKEQATPNFKES